MNYHGGTVGHYEPSNQRLILREAEDWQAMLDRWAHEGLEAFRAGNNARAEYVHSLIERAQSG